VLKIDFGITNSTIIQANFTKDPCMANENAVPPQDVKGRNEGGQCAYICT